MTEEAFLQALVAKPNDDVTRQVYADWLEEQDDEGATTRAAFLRLELELAAKKGRRGRRQKERRELAVLLEPAWLAVVDKVPIERCTFAFECPRKWENLQPIEGSTTTRFCDACKKNVHYCDSIADAREHAREGRCVAIDARLVRRPGDLDVIDHLSTVVGELA